MKKLLIISILISIPLKFSQANALKEKMHSSYADYINLLNTKLSDKQRVLLINKIQKEFSSREMDKLLMSPLLTPIRSSLVSSLNELKNLKSDQDGEYLKYKEKVLLNTCVTCHSQLPVDHFGPVAIEIPKAKDVDRVQFSLLFRNYKVAIKELKRKIFYKLDNNKSKFKIELDLNKLVEIYLAKYADTKSLRGFIHLLKSNAKYSKTLSVYLSELESSLNNWQKVKKEKLSKSEVEELVKKYLKPYEEELKTLVINSTPLLVSRSLMKRVLSQQLLTTSNKDYQGYLMYWRALCEEDTNLMESASLKQILLEECLLNYRGNIYGEKCLETYEDLVLLSYTGSSGVNLPKEEKNKIKQYRKMFSSKKKEK